MSCTWSLYTPKALFSYSRQRYFLTSLILRVVYCQFCKARLAHRPTHRARESEDYLHDKWIPHFVTEVRNKKGEQYPPRSIHLLLAGLQRYMLDKNPGSPKFLNRSESAFRDIHGTCDSVYRDLHSKGIGTEVKHASLITPEEEEKHPKYYKGLCSTI